MPNRMGAARAGICLLVGGLLMLAMAAQAPAGGLEDAYRRGRLKVGVRSDFPPFGYKDPAGEVQGFDADLARALARNLFAGGNGLELVPVTSGGRIPLLYSELIDVIVAAMTVTEDRERVLDFSAPYFVTGSRLLVRRESAIQAVADLAQAEMVPYDHIGLVQGQIYLVHRHLEGQTLSELLTTTGFLDSSSVVSIASQVCNALAPAHRAGIVHGGLSPYSVVIGADGFGYLKGPDGRHVKIPQIGCVVIEDDVEIGANAAVDRAALDETVIRRGAKIDDLVMVAHNVEVGENAILIAQAGVAGSSKIGRDVILGILCSGVNPSQASRS